MYPNKCIATRFLVRLFQSKAVNLKEAERLQIPKTLSTVCTGEIPSASGVGLGVHWNPLIYLNQLFGIFFSLLLGSD